MADISQLGFSVDVKQAQRQIDSFIRSLKGIQTASDNVQTSMTDSFTGITKTIDTVVDKFKNKTMTDTLEIYKDIASQAKDIAKAMNRTGIGKAAREESMALNGLKDMVVLADEAISSLFGSMGKADDASKKWVRSNKKGIGELIESIEKYIDKAKETSAIGVKSADFKSLEKRRDLLRIITEGYVDLQKEMKKAYSAEDLSGVRKNIVSYYGNQVQNIIEKAKSFKVEVTQDDIEKVNKLSDAGAKIRKGINGTLYAGDYNGNPIKELQSNVQNLYNVKNTFIELVKSLGGEGFFTGYGPTLKNLSAALSDISKEYEKSGQTEEQKKYESLTTIVNDYVKALRVLEQEIQKIELGGHYTGEKGEILPVDIGATLTYLKGQAGNMVKVQEALKGLFPTIPEDKIKEIQPYVDNIRELKDALTTIDATAKKGKDNATTLKPLIFQQDMKSFEKTAKEAYQSGEAVDSFAESVKKANAINGQFESAAEQMRSMQYQEKENVNVLADAKLSIDSISIADEEKLRTDAGGKASEALKNIESKIGKISITDADSVVVSDEGAISKIRKLALEAVQRVLSVNLGTARVKFTVAPSAAKGDVLADKIAVRGAIGAALNDAIEELKTDGDNPSVKVGIDVYVTDILNVYQGQGQKVPISGKFISEKLQSKMANMVQDGISVSLPMNLKLTSGRMEKNIDDIKMTIISSFKEGGSVNNVTRPLEEELASGLDEAAAKIRAAQNNALNSIASSASSAIDMYITKVEDASKGAKKKIREKLGNMLDDIDANEQMKESLGFVKDIIRLLNKAPESLEGKTTAISQFLDMIGYAGQQAQNLDAVAKSITKLNEISEIKPPKLKDLSDDEAENWANKTESILGSKMAQKAISVGIIFDGDTQGFVDSVKLSNIRIPLDDVNLNMTGFSQLTMKNPTEMAGSIGREISELLKDETVPVSLNMKVDFAKSKVKEINPGSAEFLSFVTTVERKINEDILKTGGLTIAPDIVIDAMNGSNISLSENMTREIRNAVNRSIKNISTSIQSSNLIKETLNITIDPNVIKQLQLYAESMMKIASSFKTISKSGVSPDELKDMLKISANSEDGRFKSNNGGYGNLVKMMTSGAISSLLGEGGSMVINTKKGTREDILQDLGAGEKYAIENAKETFEEFVKSLQDVAEKGPNAWIALTDKARNFNANSKNPIKDMDSPEYKAMESLRIAFSKGQGELFVQAMNNVADEFEEIEKQGEQLKNATSKLVRNMGIRGKMEEGIRVASGQTNVSLATEKTKAITGAYAFPDAKYVKKVFEENFGKKANNAFQEAKKGIDNLKQEVKELNSTQVKLDISGLDTNPLVEYQRELHSTQNAFTQMLNAMGVYVTARGVINFMRDATRQASNLNMEIRRIQTLATEFDFAPLKNGLMNINSVYGRVIDNAKALYWAYSSGVRGTTEDLVRFTKEMAKTAKSINADVMSTTDAITNMMNAYGYTTSEAGRLGDVLFTIIKEGKANAMQLTTALGNVIATASSLGITERELGAATATLTKTMGASKALTILNNIIGKMINPSNESAELMERLGLDISANAVKAKGFAQVMRELRAATQGNIGVIAKLFPDLRGQRAAVTLLSTQWEEFEKQLSNFDNVAGAREEALKSITETPEAAFAAMANTLEILKAKAGDATISFITLGGAVTPVFNALNKMGSTGKTALGWVAALGAIGTGANFIGKAASLLQMNLESASVQKNMMEVDRQRNTLLTQMSVLQGELLKKQEEASRLSKEIADKESDKELLTLREKVKQQEESLRLQRNQIRARREEIDLTEKELAIIIKKDFAKADETRALVDVISSNISNRKYNLETKEGTFADDTAFNELMSNLRSRIYSREGNTRFWREEIGLSNSTMFNDELQKAMANLGAELSKGTDIQDPESLHELNEKIRSASELIAQYIKTEDEQLRNDIARRTIEDELLKTWYQIAQDQQRKGKDGDFSDETFYSVLSEMKRFLLGNLNSQVSKATAISNNSKIEFDNSYAQEIYNLSKTASNTEKELLETRINLLKKESDLNIEGYKVLANASTKAAENYRRIIDRYNTDVENIMKNAQIRLANAQHQGGDVAASKVMDEIQKVIDAKKEEFNKEISKLNVSLPEQVRFNDIGFFKAVGGMARNTTLVPGMDYLRRIPVMNGAVRALDIGLKPLEGTIAAITLGVGKLALSSEKLNPRMAGLNVSMNKVISTISRANFTMIINSWRNFSKLTDEQRKSFEDLGKSLGLTGEQAQGALKSLSMVGATIGVVTAAIGIGTALYNLYKGKGGPLQEQVYGLAGVNRAKSSGKVTDATLTYYNNMDMFYREYVDLGKSIIPWMESEFDLLKARVNLGTATNKELEKFNDRLFAMRNSIKMLGQGRSLAPASWEEQEKALKQKDIAKEIQKAIQIKAYPTSDFVYTGLAEARRIALEKLGRELTKEEERLLISFKFVSSFEEAYKDATDKLNKEISNVKLGEVQNIVSENLKRDLKNISNEMMSSVFSAEQKLINKQYAFEENGKTRRIILKRYKDEYEAVKDLTKKYSEWQHKVEEKTKELAGIENEKKRQEAQNELDELSAKASNAKNELDKMNEAIRDNARQGVELALAMASLEKEVRRNQWALSDARKQSGSIMSNRSASDTELEILRDAVKNTSTELANAMKDIRDTMTIDQQNNVNKAKADLEDAKRKLEEDKNKQELISARNEAERKYNESIEKLAKDKAAIQDKDIYATDEYIKRLNESTKAKKALADYEAKIIDDANKRVQSSVDVLDEIRKRRLLGDEPVMRRNVSGDEYEIDKYFDNFFGNKEKYDLIKDISFYGKNKVGDLFGKDNELAFPSEIEENYRELLDNNTSVFSTDEADKNKEAIRKNFRLLKMLIGTPYEEYKAYSIILKNAMSKNVGEDEIINLEKLRDDAFEKARKDWIYRKGTKEQKTNLYVEYLQQEREELQKQYDDAMSKANASLESKDQERANIEQEKLKSAQDALINNYNSERDAMNSLAESQSRSAQEAYELAKSLNKMSSATANANKVDTLEYEKLRYRTWSRPSVMPKTESRIDIAAINERIDNKRIEYANAVADYSKRLKKTFEGQTGLQMMGGGTNGNGENSKVFSQGVKTFDTSVSNFQKTVSMFEIKAKELL